MTVNRNNINQRISVEKNMKKSCFMIQTHFSGQTVRGRNDDFFLSLIIKRNEGSEASILCTSRIDYLCFDEKVQNLQ